MTEAHKPWTAGEWTREGDFFERVRVEFEGGGHYVTLSAPDRDYPVAFVIGTPGHHWNNDPEQEANARLIAASPDMAEALLELSSIIEEISMPDCPTMTRALAATAKARAALAKAGV